MSVRTLVAALLVATSTITGVTASDRSAEAGTVEPVLVLFDGSNLVRAGLDGSNPTWFDSTSGFFPTTLSPDGTRLLSFLEAKDIYSTIHYSDGSPPVVYRASIGQFGWAPDGRHLLGANSLGLVTFDADTGATSVIPGTTDLTSARWSPDGTFIVARAGAATVSIRPDGTGRTPFTGTLPTSPNGRWTLSVNATEDHVSAVDVITGEVTEVITASDLAPGSTYRDWTWGRADDTVIELYVRRDGTTVQRFVHSLSPAGSATSSTVAVGMVRHWVGGVVPADTNGSPPAVTGLAAVSSPGTLALSWSPPVGVTDFAGVDVRYALGTTPPATPTAGLDAGRILASTRTLTPLPPDQPVAISVFSHDWSGNVGPAASIVVDTPHQSLTTLAVRASPFDLVYGTRSTVTATLRALPGGSGVAGAPITVQRRRWNTADPWTTTGTITTDATGVASFVQIPGASTEYRLLFAGDTDHMASQGSARIRVAPRVRLTADRTSGPAGTVVRLTASTAPVRSNAGSWLQRCAPTCVDVGPHLTSALGTVTYMVRLPARGTTVRYRVRVSGAGSNLITGYSNIVTLTGT
jgi:hypothetical protein